VIVAFCCLLAFIGVVKSDGVDDIDFEVNDQRMILAASKYEFQLDFGIVPTMEFKLSANDDQYTIKLGEIFECEPETSGNYSCARNQLTRILTDKMGWNHTVPEQNLLTNEVEVSLDSKDTLDRFFKISGFGLDLKLTTLTNLTTTVDATRTRSIEVMKFRIRIKNYPWSDTSTPTTSLAVVFKMYLNGIEYAAPVIVDNVAKFGNMYIQTSNFAEGSSEAVPVHLNTAGYDARMYQTGLWIVYSHFNSPMDHFPIVVGFLSVPKDKNKAYIGFVSLTAIAVAVLAAIIVRYCWKKAKKRKGTFYRIASAVSFGRENSSKSFADTFRNTSNNVGQMETYDSGDGINTGDLVELAPITPAIQMAPRRIRVRGNHSTE